MPAVNFVIGNSYDYDDDTFRTDLTKNGNTRQIHGWAIYVDFFGGERDVDLIQKVNFYTAGSMNDKQICHCPIRIRSNRWRFEVRNKTFSPMHVIVLIIGIGGSVQRRHFRLRLAPGGKESRRDRFFEKRPNYPLRPVSMPDIDFGIELELSTSSDVSTEEIAELIRAKSGVHAADMTDNYAAARSCNDRWVIMSDSSLICSRDTPECNRLELKSPILRGRLGLQEVEHVIRVLNEIHSSIKVNYSMGFHVHVNISRLSSFQLKSVCQNFIKYEQAMDILMPPSRRNGNKFCKSNRLAVEGYSQDVMESLEACNSKKELGELMCPGDRYYKLNIRPFLALGNAFKPTIEFRQHSSTYNRLKIRNWIRFCMSFVHNSAKLGPQGPVWAEVDDGELFEMMMMYVVKDRYLRDYYRRRRVKFLDEKKSCCDACAVGDGCAAHVLK
eukprot:CAMPEP_0172542232 /NCGR_PEP_ID=MMETSP1067-20121228/12894_1 /TAXON_ID=265564 ORGANISM="Thalassiosira punctigera, Strain Tpunct2005C2" /NCGR_SAMPLE_ID=MMETSP1067 /ASSEMBLY_ACC=CAM_ASM_000444 /LENGTH=441 /DNA_ID=CAMNT_0013328431 /DNA_START=253 /DNA_END=1578 /DNA_ORIENTATION=+